MTDLFTKPIDAITADDVAALLEHGPAEGPSVEYKAALSEGREEPDPWIAGGTRIGRRAQEKIVKELVAFANAGGGTLLLGIEETTDSGGRDRSDKVRRRISGSPAGSVVRCRFVRKSVGEGKSVSVRV